jgi:4-amino-4-deoxy-L-arabinose transferase-like glycosyltransferase
VTDRTDRCFRRQNATRVAAFGLAALAGALVFLVAVELFPHHSINHDEGVYLEQAALLLDGRLWLSPPDVEAFRPWFFVRDGGRLSPKYAPVPAVVFAVGMALGSARLSLAAVAAGNAALVYGLGSAAFDRRTGALAVLLLIASPLFLLTSALFLPYAPTTLLNLLFALAYVRAARRESNRWAALAGVAVGLAFFARPYTAVLFALPFVAHALLTLARRFRRARRFERAGEPDGADGAGGSDGAGAAGESRTRSTGADPRKSFVAALGRYAAVAVPALLFVGVAFGYNALVTGDALTFPYEAFAPRDGLGFGRRRLLDHAVTYTPALAVAANARVLWAFATRWAAAGPIGTVLAGVGVAVAVARGVRARGGWRGADGPRSAGGGPAGASRPAVDRTDRIDLTDGGVRALLVGVTVSVILGNVLFWGNLNLLGRLGVPGDGFVAHFGPFYHFDLLAPLSIFGAAGALALVGRVRAAARERCSPRAAWALVLVLLLLSLPVVAVAERGVLGPPIERNAAYTERYERAYVPFENRTLDDALVYVPTPYGDWLAHPFQSLRNGGSLDGPVVYALYGPPERDFAVLDAFPNRTPYRYTYRGEWTPAPEDPITARLQRLRVREGARHRITTTVGVPVGSESASVRLSTGAGAVQYAVENITTEVAVEWIVGTDGAWVVGESLRPFGANRTLALEGTEEVALSITFVGPGGSTVTYRQELAVASGGRRTRLLWPSETTVCRLVTDCGREGSYLSGVDGYLDGVTLNATVETRNSGNATASADRSV